MKRGVRAAEVVVWVAAMMFATVVGTGLIWAEEREVVRYQIVQGESKALYRVGEVFLQNNQFNVAVGMTDDVRGEILLDPVGLRIVESGPVLVNIQKFQSNSSQRDNAIRGRWLESNRYPIAEFTPVEITGLPEAYQPGAEVEVEVTGRLKIRDVVRDVTFAGILTLSEGQFKGFFQTTVLMTDFGFDPPSILGLLRSENRVDLFLDLTARPEL